jgi:hypothetical protein
LSLAAVVGDQGEADEFGDGLVGDGGYRWELGEDDGDSAVGDAFGGAEAAVECDPERVGLDQRGDLAGEHLGLADEEGDGLTQARPCLFVAGGVEALFLDGEIGGDLPQPRRERVSFMLVGRRRRDCWCGSRPLWRECNAAPLCAFSGALGKISRLAKLRLDKRCYCLIGIPKWAVY